MADAKGLWERISASKNLIDEMVRVGLGRAEHQALLGMFDDAFDEFAPKIDFQFGVDRDGIFELIVSAGGIRAKVPEVQTIVAAAPKFENWRIIAFKPRQELSLPIHVDGHVCETSNTRVHWEERNGGFDVLLFVDVPVTTAKETRTHIGFLALDSALGEVDVMMHLRSIETRSLASDPKASNLPTIAEFVVAFDKRFAGRPQ